MARYPNLEAVTQRLSSGNMQVQQQLINYATSCVKPGIQYYIDRLNGCMQTPLAAFKAARLFSPQKVQEMQPDCTAVDTLLAFPFFYQTTLEDFKTELPNYLAAVEDVNPTYDPIEFWKTHELSLRYWAKAARKVLVVQPSSAASERVFSLLNSSFGHQQNSALQDYIETSLMLQYNNR